MLKLIKYSEIRRNLDEACSDDSKLSVFREKVLKKCVILFIPPKPPHVSKAQANIKSGVRRSYMNGLLKHSQSQPHGLRLA